MNKIVNQKIYLLYLDYDKSKYYGRTSLNLGIKLSKHKNNYKKGNRKYMSRILFDKSNDINDVKIKLIENLNCTLKKAIEREQYYILKFKCVNKKLPTKK